MPPATRHAAAALQMLRVDESRVRRRAEREDEGGKARFVVVEEGNRGQQDKEYKTIMGLGVCVVCNTENQLQRVQYFLL